jgi:hypothetical protein
MNKKPVSGALNLASDQIIPAFIFMPILQDVISDWVQDHNAAPIWPQRLRSLHVPGIPNDLYRGSLNTPKQSFDFDRDLRTELEKQVLDYGASYIILHRQLRRILFPV